MLSAVMVDEVLGDFGAARISALSAFMSKHFRELKNHRATTPAGIRSKIRQLREAKTQNSDVKFGID